MTDKPSDVGGSSDISPDGNQSGSNTDKNRPDIVAVVCAIAGAGFWWGLDAIWPDAPPLAGAIAIMGAVGLWLVAGLLFAEQHLSIHWQKAPVLGAYIFGLLCGAIAIYVSIDSYKVSTVAQNPAPQVSLAPATQTRAMPALSAGRARPAPLPDGRYSLILSVVRPLSVSNLALEIRNVSDNDIDFQVTEFVVSVNNLDIIRDLNSTEGSLRPHASQRISSTQEMDIGFVTEDEFPLAIQADVQYAFSGKEAYTNTYIERFVCDVTKADISSAECETDIILDWVSK